LASVKATAPDAAISPSKDAKGEDAQELPSSEHAGPKTAADVKDISSPHEAQSAAKGVVAGVDALKDVMAPQDAETRADEVALDKAKQLADTLAALAAAKAALEELKKALASEPSPEKQAELGAKLAEAEKDHDAKQKDVDNLVKECKAAE